MKSNETNEETKMLTLKDMKFPAYFRSKGNGTIEFTDPHNGKWDNGKKDTTCGIHHFIRMHNMINPRNDESGDYFYYSKYDDNYNIAKISDVTKMVQSNNYIASGWRISKDQFAIFNDVKYIECKIENMPIGAKLIAIQNEGEWHDFRFTTKRIEIHDDVICLLAHFGNGKSNPFAGEMNIKRGTMIRYK